MADKIQYIQIPASDLPQQKVNEVGYLPPNSTNLNPSISLKEYFDSQILEKEKRYEQRFTAQQEAVLKAETATDKRFESVNEFRQTLEDQQVTFATKAEVAYILKTVEKNQDDINDVRLSLSNFLTLNEYGLRHAELQAQVTILRDEMNTNLGKNIISDPANDERFNSISKNIEALGIKIGSLQDTRSVESGATAKASSIFTRAETMIPILIAVGLLILRLMGK